MKKNNIFLKEEHINIDECNRILDFYYTLNDGNIKKGLEEITPFKDFYFMNKNLNNLVVSLIKVKSFLKLPIYKNYFIYKGVIFRYKKLNKNEVFLKLLDKGKTKVFIKIKKSSIDKGKSINIKEIISIKKGLGSIAIQKTCKFYDIYNIVVSSSIYGIGFWKKIKKKFKGEINIFIK